MARTERNPRTRFGGVVFDDGPDGGNGRADLDLKSGSDRIRAPSPTGDDDQAMTCLLGRMYRDIAEEPLPESFNALVQRLRGANTTNNGNGSH